MPMSNVIGHSRVRSPLGTCDRSGQGSRPIQFSKTSQGDGSTTVRSRLAILAAALIFAALAEGQAAGKIARIGVLDDLLSGRLPAARHRALREGLRDMGWIEGRNLVIESRYAE